ncbi:hypothetical protein [Cellulosimicrobium sp. CUA-896]|uniref:hypothetical protein n=1 Tax=Cellulosimicrobium sp. CUA-896 TaxID=1517881 RepID=UPI0009636285|nr:hypothetical protein [Cellulosimicrobium sp. CUA-896]OLT50224.1 hypothetical protein BJF88_15595 [Cellulosimicrobium sp. CUA-896]
MASTVTVPASTPSARTANAWYALRPSATSVKSRSPYGVVTARSVVVPDSLSTRTATYAEPARQRGWAVTVTSTTASDVVTSTVCQRFVGVALCRWSSRSVPLPSCAAASDRCTVTGASSAPANSSWSEPSNQYAGSNGSPVNVSVASTSWSAAEEYGE